MAVSTIHPAFADKSEGGLGLGFILLHLRDLVSASRKDMVADTRKPPKNH